MSGEDNGLNQAGGIAQEDDARYFEDSVATFDAATQIIEMLRHTRFSLGNQEEEVEDETSDPQSPTRLKVYNAGTSSWQKSSFPVVAAVSSYQRKTPS